MLASLAGRADTVVLSLPRGGVPVGCEVAMRLGAPLDVFVVRKLGMPGHEEFAIGAIASGGVRLENRELARRSRPRFRAVGLWYDDFAQITDAEVVDLLAASSRATSVGATAPR